MNPPDRQRLKLASYILQQVAQQIPGHNDRIASLTRDVASLASDLGQAQQRLQICHGRGWQYAARQQAQTLACLCREIASTTGQLQELAQSASTPPDPTPLSVREILSDLDQLETEFDHVELDAKNHTITVRTEDITLEGLYLGPFEIVLKLSDLPQARRKLVYKIIATDAHPASSNESVTHPHVRDEELCEGDATVPIRNALAGGRICDFFMLVRSVLTTYNAGSPYVALDDWDGVSCHDCGSTVERDDVSYCQDCEHDLCSDCMSYCRACDESACRNCLEDCSACGDALCRRCRKECQACGKLTCGACLEENLCPACREKVENKDDSAEPTESNVSAQPAQAA